MEFKDLPMPFQEMAANVVRSQLATLDLSTVEKEPSTIYPVTYAEPLSGCTKRSSSLITRIYMKNTSWI
ncbi:hypothetical protein ECDEC6E_1457 [Escherichia coli DEC6E]|nr:hypothetical protein ECDEC6E_1457 [Escherichia coli DEC6E]